MKAIALIALFFCAYTAITHIEPLLSPTGGSGWDAVWAILGVIATIMCLVTVTGKD